MRAAVAATRTSVAFARAQRLAQRQAGHEHEAVRRRHERRQVVEPVRVDAPEDRARQLRDRRGADDDGDLRPALGRQRPRRGDEHEPRQSAEDELARGGRPACRPPAAPRGSRRSAPARINAGTAARARTAPARARAARGRRSDRGSRSRPRRSSQATSRSPSFTRWSSQAPRKTSFFSQYTSDSPPDEGDALPVAYEVAAEPAARLVDPVAPDELDEIGGLVVVELVVRDEPELDRGGR